MFSGLKPGTNYTALLAVVSSGGGGGGGLVVVDAVAVLSGALTPDTVAPRFVSIGPMQGPSLSSAQSFAATVPLAVDKPSTVSYALYWCVNPLIPTENSESCGPDDGVDATVIGERTRDLTIHLPRPAPPIFSPQGMRPASWGSLRSLRSPRAQRCLQLCATARTRRRARLLPPGCCPYRLRNSTAS